MSYGRRLGHPRVGVAAAVFFYASSVIGIDGTIAYNDVAVAAIAFALFYLLQIWDQERTAKLLVPIGILTGFAFATKYTAFVAVPYALGFIAWKQWRARQPIFRPVLATGALALIFIVPWLVKNWIWVDNPFSPFANRLFPNPYVHIAFEEDYRKMEQNYGLTSRWQIPWELTVNGNMLAGFFGPLFLLAPIALLALRQRAGRQLWLAAVVFGLPFYANVGSRFLIPAMPFVALALALTFANVSSLLLALTIAHAISCWPRVEKTYCYFSAWRLNNIPYRAALRIEPESKFLSRRAPQYDESQMIERLVPPGEKVFSFQQMSDSYMSRESLVGYQAAFNETAQDILWTPVFNSFQPTRILTFHFPPRELRSRPRGSDRVGQGRPVGHIGTADIQRRERIAPRAGMAIAGASESVGCADGFRQQPGYAMAKLAGGGTGNVRASRFRESSKSGRGGGGEFRRRVQNQDQAGRSGRAGQVGNHLKRAGGDIAPYTRQSAARRSGRAESAGHPLRSR